MRIVRRPAVPLLLLLIASLSLAGCGKKTWYWPFGKSATETAAPAGPTDTGTPVEELPGAPPVDPNAIGTQPTDLPLPSDPQAAAAKAARDATGSIPSADALRKPGVAVTELEMIHFDYDKADIRPDAIEILNRNAEWLLQRPGLQIQIEGHCDERGTGEYNLALGQRRAEAVREHLVAKGIDANAIHTISYGKERPLAFGDNDADHAMNRRAQFLVFSE